MPTSALWVVLAVAVLLVNFFLWKRRGRGWRTHVDAMIRVLQPHVPEPVVDVIVLQPAGAVGRQARAEQGRGLSTLAGGMSGDLAGALAENRADERARDETLPPMTALAVSERSCYLLPVALAEGRWVAAPVERSWPRGEAYYATSPRALTIQVTIKVDELRWTGHYETARDPAGYTAAVLTRLASDG